jgi:PadR family transcriptional regulator
MTCALAKRYALRILCAFPPALPAMMQRSCAPFRYLTPIEIRCIIIPGIEVRQNLDLERELLKGNTPTLVLAVLRDGPLHGYGIAREIERRSENALRCKEGTLYPALHALERDGLVAGEWRREPGGRERKVYVLTPAGHAALEQRARTWTEFASAIQRVIGGTADVHPPEPAAGHSPRRRLRRNPEPAG